MSEQVELEQVRGDMQWLAESAYQAAREAGAPDAYLAAMTDARQRVLGWLDGEPARIAAERDALLAERDELRAQVDAARAYAHKTLANDEECDPFRVLRVMDEAKARRG